MQSIIAAPRRQQGGEEQHGTAATATFKMRMTFGPVNKHDLLRRTPLVVVEDRHRPSTAAASRFAGVKVSSATCRERTIPTRPFATPITVVSLAATSWPASHGDAERRRRSEFGRAPRDPFYLGLVGLVQFVPVFLLALPAGQMADRFSRKLLVGSAQLTMACARWDWRGSRPCMVRSS